MFRIRYCFTSFTRKSLTSASCPVSLPQLFLPAYVSKKETPGTTGPGSTAGPGDRIHRNTAGGCAERGGIGRAGHLAGIHFLVQVARPFNRFRARALSSLAHYEGCGSVQGRPSSVRAVVAVFEQPVFPCVWNRTIDSGGGECCHLLSDSGSALLPC